MCICVGSLCPPGLTYAFSFRWFPLNFLNVGRTVTWILRDSGGFYVLGVGLAPKSLRQQQT